MGFAGLLPDKEESNSGRANCYTAPEVKLTRDEWMGKAKELWAILDNIDTLEDSIKPTDLDGYKRFYDAVHKQHQKRFQILVSDGYNLYPVYKDGVGKASV